VLTVLTVEFYCSVCYSFLWWSWFWSSWIWC